MSEQEQRESHVRSLFKACTWRIIASATTLGISYAVTGKATLALTIAGVEGVIKMVVYYLHERAWQTVSRGTVRALFRRRLQALQPLPYAAAGTHRQERST